MTPHVLGPIGFCEARWKGLLPLANPPSGMMLGCIGDCPLTMIPSRYRAAQPIRIIAQARKKIFKAPSRDAPSGQIRCFRHRNLYLPRCATPLVPNGTVVNFMKAKHPCYICDTRFVHLAVRWVPFMYRTSECQLSSLLQASNMITQRGPHETIIASSALKGTPDAIPDPEARGATIDPRSENKMGTVMYKKTSPSLLNSSADPIAGHTLEIFEPTWEVLKTHYRRAHVTTTEFGASKS